MSYDGMNNMSDTNVSSRGIQPDKELKKERDEQEIADKELRLRAERRARRWKVTFKVFLVIFAVTSVIVSICWKEIARYMDSRQVYDEGSELFYEEMESFEEEDFVNVDAESAEEETDVEAVTAATPATSASKGKSTSHWPDYSYSDRHRYDDDEGDDDDDDTWYRGEDDPDEYYEYDFHE